MLFKYPGGHNGFITNANTKYYVGICIDGTQAIVDKALPPQNRLNTATGVVTAAFTTAHCGRATNQPMNKCQHPLTIPGRNGRRYEFSDFGL